MAAAAGKKEAVSLSIFMEVQNLEVVEELFCDGHLGLGRGNLDGTKFGESRSSRFRRGGELLCVRPVTWASSGHNGTS